GVALVAAGGAAGAGEADVRGGGVGVEEDDREVDLQLVAVAPAAGGLQRGDDVAGAGVGQEGRDVFVPRLGRGEEAAARGAAAAGVGGGAGAGQQSADREHDHRRQEGGAHGAGVYQRSSAGRVK